MSSTVTLNGTSYALPVTGERNWGAAVTSYLVALSTGVLSKAGGSFTLTADADFGATFGLKSAYYKSRATVSTAGVFRLGNAESVGWRNAANSADKLLKVNSSDLLEYDGNKVMDVASTDTVTGVKTFADGSLKLTGATSGASTLKAPAIASTYVHTLPAATDTLVGKATTDTLTNKTLTAADVTAGSYLNLLTQAAVRFNDDAGGDYVAVKAPTGVTTHTLLLPATQGAASTVLTNDGSGSLSWAAGVSATLTQYHTDIGNSSNTRIAADTNLLGDVKASIVSSTVTVTIASPGVFSLTSHGMVTGDRFYLTTTGALPTGLSASTTYYCKKVDANSFRAATSLANALAGTTINTSGSQSGTHTAVVGGMQIKASSPVTTPVIIGVTDASSASLGTVGEVISVTDTSNRAMAGTANDTWYTDSNVTITLTAGDWEVFFLASCEYVTSAIGQGFVGAIGIKTTNTAESSNSAMLVRVDTTTILTATTGTVRIGGFCQVNYSISSSQQIWGAMKWQGQGAEPTFTSQAFKGGTHPTKLWARRVR